MDLEYNVECKHDFLKLFEGTPMLLYVIMSIERK